MVQQITQNVYVEVFPISIPSSNPGFVTTSEGIVAVDTPYRPADAIRWRDDIAKKGEVRYLVNTEYHEDHARGNYFIPGIVVSHQGIREGFATSIGTPDVVRQRVRETDPENLPLVADYQLRPPTITFTEQLDLYLGSHAIELIHLPGHTPSQVGVYIPKERVIFTGDNVVNGWSPLLTGSSPFEWVRSLERIEGMDVDVIVPGHGEIGDKMVVREFRMFIQECIDRVKAAIVQGMGKEEAANRISFEGRFPALHSGLEWQRQNVIWLYEKCLRNMNPGT